MTERVKLLGLARADLEAFFVSIGERTFRARQVMKWIYQHGVDDFEMMTDLSRELRSRLREIAEIEPPQVLRRRESTDGTQKWVLRIDAEQRIETVFIPEPNRGTLCISSQVGCALDCSFCSTGAQGFNRNLTAAEIIGQVWLANRELGVGPDSERVITNVVLMGMGEPLANYRNVLPALEILKDDLGYGLSWRRVTLSTSGLVPQIEKLRRDSHVALAVSLHAPNNALRNELVPINRKHPIEELLDACWRYVDREAGRHVTFEYVMLDRVNDRPKHARQLIHLLKGKPAKVNLIPFNEFPGTAYRPSPDDVIDAFQEQLLRAGIRATKRRTRGDDIVAACGQLVGRVDDRVTSRLGSKTFRVVLQT